MASAGPTTLQPGSRVVISGLVGAAQHNGKKGTVSRFVQEKGRYAVELAGGARKLLLLKPANIKVEEVVRPPADAAGAIQQLNDNTVTSGKFGFKNLGDHAPERRA